MKSLLLVAALGLISLAGRENCKTTISVTNCQNKPVKGVKATIQKCNGEQETLKTDEDGIATSATCKKDICDVLIVSQIEGKSIVAIPKNCSGPDDDFNCRFKLCNGSN